MYAARKYDPHPFVWDRPTSAFNVRVQGILFEWAEGQLLSQVPISSNIADKARTKLKALHEARIAHNDLATSFWFGIKIYTRESA